MKKAAFQQHKHQPPHQIMLLKKLAHVVWDIWNHRCRIRIRHGEGNERDDHKLDEALVEEYNRGYENLPVRWHNSWTMNNEYEGGALQMPIACKKQWLVNVEAGCRFFYI